MKRKIAIMLLATSFLLVLFVPTQVHDSLIRVLFDQHGSG